ncbi:hypothetical protein SAMN05518849_11849 [Sphingobium sp. AP50]|uniref:hypothetical protein n=1 Tax=Sphingobium sp. AP50 TaxID=1884369 RepID=UPI0008B7CE30|nr:hypothetical protein [Sphingobium sp. AP50]SEJ91909.1 hypothetical protein SAMN05518849_11849 [Sphingobium sp. AP50]
MSLLRARPSKAAKSWLVVDLILVSCSSKNSCIELCPGNGETCCIAITGQSWRSRRRSGDH